MPKFASLFLRSLWCKFLLHKMLCPCLRSKFIIFNISPFWRDILSLDSHHFESSWEFYSHSVSKWYGDFYKYHIIGSVAQVHMKPGRFHTKLEDIGTEKCAHLIILNERNVITKKVINWIIWISVLKLCWWIK